jgi:alpha-tubulin suppressor-like RCC1 family protein
VLLDEAGNAYAWGNNKFGQCGVNKKDEVIMEPTRVELNDVIDIATGGNHTLFLLKGGAVYVCGLPKDDRFPSKSNHEIKPIKYEGLDKHKIIGVSCGKRHNIFLSE